MDVSVVIPLHDDEATIGEALDSLLPQGGIGLEAIVVDDRSTDRGPGLARAHPIGPRLLSSPRPGPSAARNTGFAVARGRYVVFLDADDVLLAGALPARVAAADEAGGTGVVVGQYADLVDGKRRSVEDEAVFRDGAAATLMRGNRLALHAALVPRTLLATLDGPFDETMWHGEDWDVWLRLACRGVPFVVLDSVDCLYRRRGGSLSTDRDRVADDAIRLLERAREWLPSGEAGAALEAVRRIELHRWHRHRALRRLRQGSVAGAAADVLAAAAAAPARLLEWPRLLTRRSST